MTEGFKPRYENAYSPLSLFSMHLCRMSEYLCRMSEHLCRMSGSHF